MPSQISCNYLYLEIKFLILLIQVLQTHFHGVVGDEQKTLLSASEVG